MFLFCGCGLNFFLPLRNAVIDTDFFRLNILNRNAKPAVVNLLMLKSLRGTYLTYKMYVEYPVLFKRESPPSPLEQSRPTNTFESKN